MKLTYNLKYVTQYLCIVSESQRHEYLTVLHKSDGELSADIDSPVPVRLGGFQFLRQIQ
jgi:hypothetical protein